MGLLLYGTCSDHNTLLLLWLQWKKPQKGSIFDRKPQKKSQTEMYQNACGQAPKLVDQMTQKHQVVLVEWLWTGANGEIFVCTSELVVDRTIQEAMWEYTSALLIEHGTDGRGSPLTQTNLTGGTIKFTHDSSLVSSSTPACNPSATGRDAVVSGGHPLLGPLPLPSTTVAVYALL